MCHRKMAFSFFFLLIFFFYFFFSPSLLPLLPPPLFCINVIGKFCVENLDARRRKKKTSCHSKFDLSSFFGLTVCVWKLFDWWNVVLAFLPRILKFYHFFPRVLKEYIFLLPKTKADENFSGTSLYLTKSKKNLNLMKSKKN